MQNEYSFEDLCLPCYDELLAYATKRTKGNQQKALDVVQDSYVRAMKAWDRWIPQGDPVIWARAWMYKIVGNTFKLRYTREKKFRMICDAGTATATQVANELFQDLEPTHVYAKPMTSLGDEVREALDRIKPEQADVIRLIYVEGMMEQEAAAELGIPYGTARSRHARGRMALARILAPIAKQRFGYGVLGSTQDSALGSADEVLDGLEAT